jgi:hypothetical protein
VREVELLEVALQSRRVRAFRKPDAGRIEADVPAGRVEAVDELGADRVRPLQQRQVRVRRRAGQHLEVTGARQVRDSTDEVAREASAELAGEPRVVIDIAGGEALESILAEVGEAANILLRAALLVRGVLVETLDDLDVGELLEEDRRQPDGEAKRDSLFAEIEQNGRERQVRSEDGLVHPLLTVRPAAGGAGVRQVTVEHEPEGVGHRVLRVPLSDGSCRAGGRWLVPGEIHLGEG